MKRVERRPESLMVIPEAGQWEGGEGAEGFIIPEMFREVPHRCVCVFSGSRPERSSDYLGISLWLRNIKKHELSRIWFRIQRRKF